MMLFDNTTPDEHMLKGNRRLRFRNAEDSLESAREGVHRWWWEFLRLSKNYWLVCQTSGRMAETNDEDLARVYQAFGNVYDCSFDDWWLDRGSRVFREQERFPKVTVVDRNPRNRTSQRPIEDHIWVDIPLKLSRRTIQRKIGEILEAYEEQRLRNRLELSTSNFKLNPVQYRINTLKKMYEIYILHRELIAKPEALRKLGAEERYEKRADLFRIGVLMRVSPSNESLRGDAKEIFKRQNRMRASVSRMLKRTELVIDNLEQGIFPSFQPVIRSNAPRFNRRQLQSHKELELDWWTYQLTSTLASKKIEDVLRIHYEERLRTRETW